MLTKHDSVTLTSDGSLIYGNLSGALSFKKEATASTGYSDISSVDNWHRYWAYTGIDYYEFRNTLINDYVGSWGTLSDADKKILVEHHVYPASTTTADLDALWTAAERAEQRLNLVKQFENCAGCRVKTSATTDSETLVLITIHDGNPPTWTPSDLATDTVQATTGASPPAASQKIDILSEATTTSTTWVDMPGMTLTTNKLDTYLIISNITGYTEASKKTLELRVVIDNVADPNSERNYKVTGNESSITTISRAIVATGKIIKIQWKTNSGPAVKIGNRSLIIYGS